MYKDIKYISLFFIIQQHPPLAIQITILLMKNVFPKLQYVWFICNNRRMLELLGKLKVTIYEEYQYQFFESFIY